MLGARSGRLMPFPAPPASGTLGLGATINATGPVALALSLPITDVAALAAELEQAIRAAKPTDPAFADARVLAGPDHLLALPGIVAAAPTKMASVVFSDLAGGPPVVCG